MYMCRLFHRDRPAEQIDARLIASGALTLGRDPGTDWPLDDAERLLSRIHCTLSVEDGTLLLRDSSTNGTFLDDGTRVEPGVAVALREAQRVQLGALTLLVDRPPQTNAVGATLIHLPSALPAATWDGPPLPRRPHPDASLLEAFCEGARIDASAFSDEDPVALMRRLGGLYQQAVLGLVAVMGQRTACKQAHALERTTVQAGGNNPIKWTAPRRLAQDLLRAQGGAFLTGEEAVRAAFVELADHLAGLAAGANAALAETLAQLDPDACDPAAGFSLRGKAGQQIDALRIRHAALRDGGATRAFREGYDGASAAAQP